MTYQFNIKHKLIPQVFGFEQRKTFTLLTFYHYILLAIRIVNILTGNRKFDVSCVKGELKSKEDYTQEKDMKFLGGMEDHCAFTGYVRGS